MHNGIVEYSRRVGRNRGEDEEESIVGEDSWIINKSRIGRIWTSIENVPGNDNKELKAYVQPILEYLQKYLDKAGYKVRSWALLGTLQDCCRQYFHMDEYAAGDDCGYSFFFPLGYTLYSTSGKSTKNSESERTTLKALNIWKKKEIDVRQSIIIANGGWNEDKKKIESKQQVCVIYMHI